MACARACGARRSAYLIGILISVLTLFHTTGFDEVRFEEVAVGGLAHHIAYIFFIFQFAVGSTFHFQFQSSFNFRSHLVFNIEFDVVLMPFGLLLPLVL